MERAQGPGQVTFNGRTFSVRVDPVLTRSGDSTREVVVRGPAIAILAETDRGVVVIRQYRWAIQQWMWELPAGRQEAGEDRETAARRELEEETGWRASSLQWIDRFYPSPGYSTEWIDLFYTRDLVSGHPHPDPDEELELYIWGRSEVLTRLQRHEIQNGVTLFGLNWWLRTRSG